MHITDLAPELTDLIIDQLFDDPPSLKATALTCRRFLAASQFHLFTDVEIKPRSFSTHPFPQNLAFLVQKLRLKAESEPQNLHRWGFPLGGWHAMPVFSLSIGQLCEGFSPFTAQELELEGIKSSLNTNIFAAAVTTKNLVNNVTSLSLKSCCIDVEDSLTLAYSFPHLRRLRFCALTFDNSRSIIRRLEHASLVHWWTYNGTSSDWSTISDSVCTDRDLDLCEIEVQNTEWTEDLRAMMVSLFDHLAVPSEKFDLRVNVSPSDLSSGQDYPGGPSAFVKFLTRCGDKIRRLDLCFGEMSTSGKEIFEHPATSICPELHLGWIFDLCPGIDVLRLSGSLCTSQFVEQYFDKLKPSARIIGFGNAREELDWHNITNPLLTFGSNPEKVVISERGSSRAEERRRRDLALEKLREVS